MKLRVLTHTQTTTHMSNPQFSSFEDFKVALVEQTLKIAEETWPRIELQRRLEGLHKELGFKTTDDLVTALKLVAKATAKKPAAPKKTAGKKTAGKGAKKVVPAATESAPATAPAAKKAPAKKTKRGGKRVRLSPEIIAQIHEAKAKGLGVTAISRQFGISGTSVYNVLKTPSAPAPASAAA